MRITILVLVCAVALCKSPSLFENVKTGLEQASLELGFVGKTITGNYGSYSNVGGYNATVLRFDPAYYQNLWNITLNPGAIGLNSTIGNRYNASSPLQIYVTNYNPADFRYAVVTLTYNRGNFATFGQTEVNNFENAVKASVLQELAKIWYGENPIVNLAKKTFSEGRSLIQKLLK